MRVFVLNGWAAGPETWALCAFPRDATFSYLEQLDGLPERALADVDEAVLVGFSMGGNSALRLLLRFPEKVCGLVLVSASAFLMEDKAAGWAGLSERRLAALSLGTRLAFENDPSELFGDANLDRGLAYLRSSDLREPLRGLSRTPFGPRLARMPVEVFQSERDGITRPANADFLKSVFPQAAVTRVPGREHVLPVTIPEQVDAAVAHVKARVWYNTRSRGEGAHEDRVTRPTTP